jgi:hypothetical protein
VLGRNAFVAKTAVDLEHALEPADYQSLQVELRRDAQEKVDVERVVMRDERFRGGAARDGLHHRRLDLDVRALLEERAHARDHARAREERSRVRPLTMRSR